MIHYYRKGTAAVVPDPVERGGIYGIHNLFYLVNNSYCFVYKKITAL